MRRVRRRRPQAGFTLIEIMFVVAIIAVLAALAIPAFTEQSRKTKANSEVVAFFAELAAKEENFKVDQGIYRAATTACPAGTLSGTAQLTSPCVASGQPWGPDVAGVPPTRNLNVALPMLESYCRYTITTGTTTGTNNPSGFTFTSPGRPWYYILAECDLDADGTLAKYFTSSIDSTIQKQNEGE
jgi:prepilin-type N-terminal cleavage/methylation domain-containing protein